MPPTNAETLSGKEITLPDTVRGHLTILIVGFSRKGGERTGDWNRRLRQELASDHGIEIHQVAELQGAPRLLRGMIVSGMKKGTPADQHDSFFVLFEGEGAWKQWVGLTSSDDPYVVLTDKSGQAVWKTHGLVNDAAIGELKRQVQSAESH